MAKFPTYEEMGKKVAEKALDEYIYKDKTLREWIDILGKTQWIPVSERLPENGHYYLWCSDMGSVQSDYYWDGFEKGMKYGYNIVAWMPLPEPYKGDN